MMSEVKVFLRGGLGNQLFQYAAGLAISKAHGRDLILREDLLPEREDTIGGINRWPNQIALFEHTGSVEYRKHQPRDKTNLTGKLMAVQRAIGDIAPALTRSLGLHTSEKRSLSAEIESMTKIRSINAYMSHLNLVVGVRHILAEELRKIREPSVGFSHLMDEATKLQPTIVHLRLGDYSGLGDIFGKLGPDYFRQALLRSGVSERWVFTQDRNQIPDDILTVIEPDRVIDGSQIDSSIENMTLMSSGSTFVGSNSTLSWWSAFLSSPEAKILAPQFEGRVNNFATPLCLPDWRMISVD